MNRSFGRGRSLALVTVVLAVVFSLIDPGTFPTSANLESMAFQMSDVGLLALAIALTMIGGGIDLSVVATANLAAITAGAIVSAHGGDGTPATIVVFAVCAALVVGVAVGAANGVLVAYGGIHPILATLATMTLITGLGTAATGGSTVFGQEAFGWVGSGTVWFLPVALILVLAAAAVLAVVLRSTLFGVRLYLVGANPIAASFSAIPVRRTLLTSYIISGALAAMSGLIVLGRTNAANVDFGGSFVLLSILVAVLAGINPYGGEGRIVDVLIALAAVQILSTGVNSALVQQSASNFLKEASWGLLLVVMLAAPAVREARSARRRTSAAGTSESSETAEATEASLDHALRLRSVSKSFGGVRALHEASLDVRVGTVHALVGENGSGKSTLTKIAAGVHRADSGMVEIAGSLIASPSPKATSEAGLEVIYQDLALFPDLTVAENIYLAAGRARPTRPMKWREANELAAQSIQSLGVDIDVQALVGDLPVAEKQLVAIARALSTDARVVIMDEPTAALTPKEIDRLMTVVSGLAAEQGLSFVFISHKLEEIFALSHDVTVIRDGLVVAAGPCSHFDAEELRRLMSGDRSTVAERRTPAVGARAAGPILELRRASIAGKLEEVSFDLYPGEVVGIGGPLGSGRREIALAVFGLLRLTGGSILVEGKPFDPRTATEAQQRGIALVPEDRQTEGLFMDRSIGTNITSASLERKRGRFVSSVDNDARVAACVDRLTIKTMDHRNLVTTLSGGNQQRVVLGKWLETAPRVLVLDRPTVGVDVGSKAGIYQVIRDLADEGVAILLVTDEIDELTDLCDRILVMNEGRLIMSSTPTDIDATQLRRAVTGREVATC